MALSYETLRNLAKHVRSTREVSILPTFQGITLYCQYDGILGWFEGSELLLISEELHPNPNPESGQKPTYRHAANYRRHRIDLTDPEACNEVIERALDALNETRKRFAATIGAIRQIASPRGYGKLFSAESYAFDAFVDYWTTTELTRGYGLLWHAMNWRYHLPACATAIVTGDTSVLDDAWFALDRGSWVAPQLVAALHLVDPHFVPNARRRIEAPYEQPAEPSDTASNSQAYNPMKSEYWMEPRLIIGKTRGALETMLADAGEDIEVTSVSCRDFELGVNVSRSWFKKAQPFLGAARD